MVPQTVNADLFGGKPVVTLSTANSVQAVNVVVISSSNSGLGSNIQNGRGSGVSISGTWKFVATIAAGDRSKTSSIYWQGTTTFSDALAAAQAWVNIFADLLGNAGLLGLTDTTPSAASPYITYLRITDALNPRYGALIQSPSGNVQYCGLAAPSGGSNPADFLATALSMRLYGVNGTLNASGYANHAIYGPPDAVVVNGDQLFLDLPVASQTYGYWVKKYLKYIFTTGNGLGFMIQDPREEKFGVSGFVNAIAAGQTVPTWNLYVPGHDYETGDRVSLTQVNNPFFRGRYKIFFIDATHIGLVNGPPSSIVPVPTTGKVQLYQDSDGTKATVFAQATDSGVQLVPPYGLKVAKRNPARPFSAVSFRRKAQAPLTAAPIDPCGMAVANRTHCGLQWVRFWRNFRCPDLDSLVSRSPRNSDPTVSAQVSRHRSGGTQAACGETGRHGGVRLSGRTRRTRRAGWHDPRQTALQQGRPPGRLAPSTGWIGSLRQWQEGSILGVDPPLVWDGPFSTGCRPPLDPNAQACATGCDQAPITSAIWLMEGFAPFAGLVPTALVKREGCVWSSACVPAGGCPTGTAAAWQVVPEMDQAGVVGGVIAYRGNGCWGNGCEKVV